MAMNGIRRHDHASPHAGTQGDHHEASCSVLSAAISIFAKRRDVGVVAGVQGQSDLALHKALERYVLPNGQAGRRHHAEIWSPSDEATSIVDVARNADANGLDRPG